jgi:DNA transposition AAA+ family ATPase
MNPKDGGPDGGGAWMPQKPQQPDTFDLLGQEGQMAKSTRMSQPGEVLSPEKRTEIIARFTEYVKVKGIKRADVCRQIGIESPTLSEILRGVYKVAPETLDAHLRQLNNWVEIDSRRDNLLANRDYVETTIARKIITAAEYVIETCGMGAVWGPARIGKTFTLEAIAREERYGHPLLFRVNAAHASAIRVCRMMCAQLGLAAMSAFDVVYRNLIKHLKGTRKLLMFDEADRCDYKALEFIRDVHDETGCPVLLAGKPTIYQKLGFREMGSFREVTDQLAGRIVIRCDLTEHTRTKNGKPRPLYTIDDIRKIIAMGNFKLHVTRDAEDWLQDRASSLGMGGIGRAKSLLFLAAKVAARKGMHELTAQHLAEMEENLIGSEESSDMSKHLSTQEGLQIRKLA